MGFKNPKNRQKYLAQYYQNNKKTIKNRRNQYHKDNQIKENIRSDNYYRSTWKPKMILVKIEVLSFYSKNNFPECECCGESILEFLTLDHINNDGAKKRAKGLSRGQALYQYLKKNNFPYKEELRVMCFNCNSGRSVNGGICPHENHRK